MPQSSSRVVLHPGGAAGMASAVALVLLLANVVSVIANYGCGANFLFGLVPLVDFDTEQNLPSFFSGGLLLTSSLLFGAIWRASTETTTAKPRWIWFFLAGLFLFLTFDELFQVHERLIFQIRNRYHFSGVLYFSWILVYGAGALLLAMAFIPIWLRQSRDVRLWMGLSAATYLAGSIGMEMAGGMYFESVQEKKDLTYAVLYTIEESLEMAGLIMLMYSLLLLLQRDCGGFALVVSDDPNQAAAAHWIEADDASELGGPFAFVGLSKGSHLRQRSRSGSNPFTADPSR